MYLFKHIQLVVLDEDDTFSLVDTFTEKALRAMTRKVIEAVAEKYPDVIEGVENTVGGNIIEFEALKIKRQGILEGEIKGKNEIVENMIRKHFSGNAIMEATDYSHDQIEEIAKKINVPVSWNVAAAN